MLPSWAAPSTDWNAEDFPEVDLPPPENEPPQADAVPEMTYRISRSIHCPVCQAESIADSSTQAAQDMRKRIRSLVERGYSEQQIRDYFAERFGDWIVLSPRAQGLNWLVWLVPPIFGGVALTWLTLIVSRWRVEPDEVPLPSDIGDMPRDPYEERLLQELERS